MTIDPTITSISALGEPARYAVAYIASFILGIPQSFALKMERTHYEVVYFYPTNSVEEK